MDNINARNKNISVEGFFRVLPTRTVYYCPNPGNTGDSLIAQSTIQLFERLGIEYKFISVNTDLEPNGLTIVYGGGGSLVPQYKFASGFVRRHHASARAFVVLPQSVLGQDDLLSEFGSNVHLFCREQISYKYVLRSNTKANVYLDHDMALSLDIPPILASGYNWKAPSLWLSATITSLFTKQSHGLTLRRLSRIPRLLRRHRRLLSDPTILHSFRTDEEKTDIALPPDNLDAAGLFALGMKSEDLIIHSSKMILSFIDQYDIVHTNRLHVCIAAALLGKIVHFYPNSYYKCRAVYDMSLRHRFPKIIWEGR